MLVHALVIMSRWRLGLNDVRLNGVFITGLALLLAACQNDPYQPGRELAQQYCAGCHMTPDPGSINKGTWDQDVLPEMAARLGYETMRSDKIEELKSLHLFPDTTGLSAEQWNQIREYFVGLAPAFTGPSEKVKPISTDLPLFRPVAPDLSLRDAPPFMSMLEVAPDGRVLFGNAVQMSLNDYQVADGHGQSLTLTGSPSHRIPVEDGMYVLTMGEVMPHNKKIGSLTFLPENEEGEWGQPEVLIDDLQRPVHGALADLDGDGREDMVISSFGYFLGELAWYSDVRSADRKKHILRPLPGAVKTVIEDVNGDNLPDILALMAQGDEGFYLYQNRGDGTFEEKSILRFPPNFGSTYFDWTDVDGDGLKDLLYVNGDNGDYQPIVKSYHGIRLFRNMGNMEFEESWFIEQHGAFKAIMEDFDGDGDRDMAAISYFPDYDSRPEESFVYYENDGGEFIASTFEAVPRSKWLTMAAGDTDGDGDTDLLLGSGMFMTSEVPRDLMKGWRGTMVPFLILENTTQ